MRLEKVIDKPLVSEELTPQEFVAAMRVIAGAEPDVGHSVADELMCRILKKHGYGEGVAIFEEMKRWNSE